MGRQVGHTDHCIDRIENGRQLIELGVQRFFRLPPLEFRRRPHGEDLEQTNLPPLLSLTDRQLIAAIIPRVFPAESISGVQIQLCTSQSRKDMIVGKCSASIPCGRKHPLPLASATAQGVPATLYSKLSAWLPLPKTAIVRMFRVTPSNSPDESIIRLKSPGKMLYQ